MMIEPKFRSAMKVSLRPSPPTRATASKRFEQSILSIVFMQKKPSTVEMVLCDAVMSITYTPAAGVPLLLCSVVCSHHAVKG